VLPGEIAVVDDLLDHPDSAVCEITARTGFAQSYVSVTVARLRDKGWVETAVDPADRRRTLVWLPHLFVRAIREREARPLDRALTQALPDLDARARAEVMALLDALAQQLLPGRPGTEGPMAGTAD
jgi:DNA-binding MarR family transcriptional regulator